MSDSINKAITDLKGQLPSPRSELSEAEKDELIARIGPRAARDVIKAKKDFPLARIPFLFSSLDTQAVVDLLAHDFSAALKRAFPDKR